nr:carboxypeptidase regulatory-like domain-containing protein [Deltaproteobacteria bacterium]
SDGYFEIFGVLPGGYTVGAIGEDALPNFMGSSAQVRDEDVTNVLVTMDAGIHLRGRVSPPGPAQVSILLDAEGMSIGMMTQSMSNAVVRTRADADGNFDLHPVAAGSITVVAEADDGSRGELAIDVADTDVEGLTIELEPRASVRGRVVDAAGSPGAGLTVAFRPTKKKKGAMSFNFNGMVQGQSRATTDEDGNYTVRGLDAGDYEVSVTSGRGPTLEWAEPVDPKKPTEPVPTAVTDGEQRTGFDLVVEARNGVITGVVLGAEGGPVADAWVTAVRNDSASELFKQLSDQEPDDGSADDDDEIDEDRKRDLRRWESVGMAEPPVLTDENGRFEVRELRSGTYRLRAEAHKDGSRDFVEPVNLGDNVQVELEPLSGLEGVVVWKGKPVREFTVEARGKARRQQQIFDEEGKFLMPRLDTGSYDVIVSCEHGNAREEVEIAAGSTASVTLEIGGWGSLSGKVIDAATGDPIPGLSVTVMGEGGSSARSMMGMFTGVGPRTGEDGRFSVDEVPPGEGKVMFFDRDATGMGGVVAETDYEIEADEERDLGTINGVATSNINPDERGTLGLLVKVATYAKRPRAPEAEDDEEQAALDKTKRLWVSHVTPKGPAAIEGLVPGDEIISVDNTGVVGMGAGNAATLLSPRQLRVGDDVTLEIEHDGSRRSLTITAIARDEDADED